MHWCTVDDGGRGGGGGGGGNGDGAMDTFEKISTLSIQPAAILSVTSSVTVYQRPIAAPALPAKVSDVIP
jgi:hypothetical protein